MRDRVGKLLTWSPESLGLGTEKSCRQGSGLLPQEGTTLGRQRHKTKYNTGSTKPITRTWSNPGALSPAWIQEVGRSGTLGPYLFGASTGRRPRLGADWHGVYPI